jgi:multiple sugar transport system substrate-binding protein
MKAQGARLTPTRRHVLAGALGAAGVAAAARPRRASAQQTTLSMIGLAGHPSWLATKAMIQAYKEVAPNVRFELSEFDLPQINDKVNLDFQAKKGQYDIVWMNSAQTIGYWSEAGIVTALDPMLSESYDLGDFLRLAREIGTIGGRLYGIPIMIEDRMLVYRKDLLDAAGLAAPTTIEQMTAAARAMTDKAANRFGFTQRVRSGASVAFDWTGWLYAFGGRYFDAGFNTQLASPAAIDALKAFLAINQYTPPSSNRSYGEIVKELQTGVATMANDVTIITPLLEDASASRFAGRFGYAVAPGGPSGPRPMTSSHLLAISALSRQREPAWRFIEWMTSKQNNKAWVLAGGAAFRESMYRDPEIIARFPQYTLFKQILDRGNADYIPRLKPSFEIITRVGEELSAALVGVKPVDQALAAADQQVAAILKRHGYKA